MKILPLSLRHAAACFGAALALTAALLPQLAHAQSYTITNLGTTSSVNNAPSFSSASAINSNGQVATSAGNSVLWTPAAPNSPVGSLVFTSSGFEALAINSAGDVVGESGANPAVFANGTTTTLPVLSGDTVAEATGINDSNIIVGTASTVGDRATSKAFISNGTTVMALPTLGGNDGSASGINNAGEIVGFSNTTTNGIREPFIFTNGVTNSLGGIVGPVTGFLAINNPGQVAGGFIPASGGEHAFLWTPATPNGLTGSQIDLGVLSGFTGSLAMGLNDNGAVVGELIDQVNRHTQIDHAFLYQNGAMIDLNSVLPANSGWVLNTATGINDKGQIVGNGQIDGSTFGYLLTPVTGATPPLPPANLVGKPGNNTASLSWAAAANATSYVVLRATTASGTFTAIASGVTATSFKDTTVTNGTQYFYAVASVNGVGEGQQSEFVSVLPAVPPSPPTGVSARTQTSGSTTLVFVTGTPSASPNIVQYNLYRKSGTGAFALITNEAADNVLNTISIVDNPGAGTFTYAMTEVNTSGEESAMSNTATVRVAGSTGPIN